MKSAVLGYTGLVGSHLMEGDPNRIGINRANISELATQEWETLYVSAMPAEKWLANKEPQADLENLYTLQNSLMSVRTKRVVLISTVDVFDDPNGVDESSVPTPSATNLYGGHRLMLEQFVLAQFPQVWIVRLPGLVSPRLKKNLIFDIKHGKSTSGVPINSNFQFYPLRRINGDLEWIQGMPQGFFHLTAAPLSTSRIAEHLKIETSNFGAPTSSAANYDFRSMHAETWGTQAGYQVSADESLAAISTYLMGGDDD